MEKISEEDYLKECKRFLEYFNKDISGDTIEVHSGDHSCIMNPKSQWIELFGGHSIMAVARYVAEKTGKKIKYLKEYD